MGAFLFWAHRRGIRTRQGAELRKREAFSSAAREGRRPEAKAGGVSRTRHPSSPTTELETVLARGPFLFAPIAGGFEPHSSLVSRAVVKNAKYEYCYLFCNSIFEVPKGKSDIKATANGPDEHVF